MRKDEPSEWVPILVYLNQYPNFFFRSSSLAERLSREGMRITPQRLSKLLLDMYSSGILERFTRGQGNHKKSYYRIKKLGEKSPVGDYSRNP